MPRQAPASNIALLQKSVIAKARKLLEVRRELVEKLSALDDELEVVFGGGATVGDKMKAFTLAWVAAWSARYHSNYVFNAKKEMPLVKTLVQKFTQEDLQARIISYIRSDDEFLRRLRHPLGVFTSSINSYAGEGSTPEGEWFGLPAPVADCKHVPTCRSDQEHTARRRSERLNID